MSSATFRHPARISGPNPAVPILFVLLAAVESVAPVHLRADDTGVGAGKRSGGMPVPIETTLLSRIPSPDRFENRLTTAWNVYGGGTAFLLLAHDVPFGDSDSDGRPVPALVSFGLSLGPFLFGPMRPDGFLATVRSPLSRGIAAFTADEPAMVRPDRRFTHNPAYIGAAFVPYADASAAASVVVLRDRDGAVMAGCSPVFNPFSVLTFRSFVLASRPVPPEGDRVWFLPGPMLPPGPLFHAGGALLVAIPAGAGAGRETFRTELAGAVSARPGGGGGGFLLLRSRFSLPFLRLGLLAGFTEPEYLTPNGLFPEEAARGDLSAELVPFDRVTLSSTGSLVVDRAPPIPEGFLPARLSYTGTAAFEPSPFHGRVHASREHRWDAGGDESVTDRCVLSAELRNLPGTRIVPGVFSIGSEASVRRRIDRHGSPASAGERIDGRIGAAVRWKRSTGRIRSHTVSIEGKITHLIEDRPGWTGGIEFSRLTVGEGGRRTELRIGVRTRQRLNAESIGEKRFFPELATASISWETTGTIYVGGEESVNQQCQQ